MSESSHNLDLIPYNEETEKINMLASIKLNNKDLLLVSLLEYICNIHNKPTKIFYIICNYLKDNGIIEEDDVYSLDTSYLREIYINLVKTLIQDKKTIEYKDKNEQKFNDFYFSRYRSDFIELEKLGRGGFGSVFKAYNKLDTNLYAIKKIPIKKLDDEKSNFYLNEVRNLSKLNHPNIVRYYNTWIEFSEDTNLIESDEEDKANCIRPILHIQMELCSLSLSQYLEDRNYSGIKTGDFGIERKIFRQILLGVKHIHSNDIVHRDLSPRNIFLDENYNVKIGDFGLSKETRSDDTPTIIYGSYGNLTYMAPEEIDDNICTKKSDIYSLGIIYLELLLPFSTLMERFIMIQSIKDGELEKFKIDKKDLDIIIEMIQTDYEKRPSIDEIYDLFMRN